MADIFLSYKREDQRVAKAVAEDLRAHGLTVFFDVHIPVGDRWDEVIERELKTARAVVVLWSPASRESRWVRLEARNAQKRYILCPTLIAVCDIPLEFSDIQAANLVGRQSGDQSSPEWHRLLAAIEACFQRRPTNMAPWDSDQQQAKPDSSNTGRTDSLDAKRLFALSRSDGAVLHALLTAALQGETVAMPDVLRHANRRLPSGKNFDKDTVIPAINRINRILLLIENVDDIRIPMLSSIALEPKSQSPPRQIDGDIRAYLGMREHGLEAIPSDDLHNDRERSMARLQTRVFGFPHWDKIWGLVGLPPSEAPIKQHRQSTGGDSRRLWSRPLLVALTLLAIAALVAWLLRSAG